MHSLPEWTSEEFIYEAERKIKGKTKRECIEKGLYAEWMAVYRFYKASDKTHKEKIEKINNNLKWFENLIDNDHASAEFFITEILEILYKHGMLDIFWADYRSMELLFKIIEDYKKRYGSL